MLNAMLASTGGDGTCTQPSVAAASVMLCAAVNAVMVRLLEEALSALGDGDSSLGARLGARLAAALMPPRTQEDADRVRDTALASLAMARRLGHAETLLYVLDHARSSLAFMIPGDARFEISRESVTLAQMLDPTTPPE